MGFPLRKSGSGVCVVAALLLFVAIAGAATPPGIAKNPSNARCLNDKYKTCYNLVHVCPKFCPDSCHVHCQSCKPICGPDTSPPSPPDEASPPPTITPPSPPSNDGKGGDDGKAKSPPPSDGKGDDKGKGGDDSGKGDGGDDKGKGKGGDDGKAKSPPPSSGKEDDKGKGGDDKGKGDGGDDKGKGKGDDDGKDKGGDGKSPPPKSTPPSPSPPPPPTPKPPTPYTPPPPTPTPPTPSTPPPTPPTTPPTPTPPTPPTTPPSPIPTPPTPTPPTPNTPPPTTPPSPIPTPPTPTPPTPATPPPATPPSPTPTPPTPTPPTPTTPPSATPPSPTPTPPTPAPPTPTTPPSATPPSPTPTPPTPAPPTPTTPPPSPTPTPPTPTPPTPPTTPPSPPTSTPPTPLAPTPSPPAPVPPAPPGAYVPVPPSGEANGLERHRCKNKKYTHCYGVEHVCPSACPYTCEVDCVSCKPVCKCDMPGAVCQDPRFIGGDGITFYFHGKKDQDFCLVTDPNLHINAHFIGKRNQNMRRDFTWVQSIAILFGRHRIFLAAQKTAAWDSAVDRLFLAVDGAPIAIPTTEGATWNSPTATVTRDGDTNSVVIEVDGLFKISAKVVPIGQQESRIHNYGITDEDCFAHLELGFKFFSLSAGVNGVLGQTYGDKYVSRVKMGVQMPVIGGEREFAVSNIYATDCAVSLFRGGEMLPEKGVAVIELPSMKCGTGIGGSGVVCKR